MTDSISGASSPQTSRSAQSGAPLAVWRHQPHSIPSALQAVELAADLEIKDWPTAVELGRLACDDRALEERLRRKQETRRSLGNGSSFPLAVHAWRIGDAVLVGCAGEAYSQLQKESRSRFPISQ